LPSRDRIVAGLNDPRPLVTLAGALAGIQAFFAGDAQTIVRWLSAYMRAGARHIGLRVADDDQEAALELLGERVLPAARQTEAVVA